MVDYSYVVTLDPAGTPIVITNDIQELEVVDVGTGEIKSAKITLNAPFGKYITTTPVLIQFDLIQIDITDEDSTTYSQFYEVDRIVPVKNSGEGIIVEVELLGQEQWIQKLSAPKQQEFRSATEVTKDIGDFYNDVKGTLQPLIQGHDIFTTGNNELPQFTSNDYFFGVGDDKLYDNFMEVINRLGAAVANAGAGDFFELYFDSNIADSTKINFQAFSSGSKPAPGSEVTISDTTSVNEAPTEGGIDAITGTLIKAWGRKGQGTLPQSVQDFSGQLTAFALDKEFIPGITYPADQRTQLNGVHYRANTETTDTPPSGDWDVVEFNDIQGVNGYSEWTENKADEWKSSGSDPSNTNKGLGCWDSNLVIDDETFFQTWVHLKSTTDNFDFNYKYGASSIGNYRGLRVLVNGTGINGFAGLDRFGRSFDNNIAIYDGTEWVVLYETEDDWYTAVRNEGIIYQKQTGIWTDVSSDPRANHCFHIVDTITNIPGYNSTPDGSGGTYGDNSAVEWKWSYNALAVFIDPVTTTDEFYKIGAWACWSVPFPENSYNGNTLGELYGNNPTKKEPATLDNENMHLTRSGDVGYNNSEARDHGEMDGIQFWNKFEWRDLFDLLTLQGNFKMRCTLYDTNDNVVIQDFTIPFNNLWHQVSLPFSRFEPYRSRISLANGNIAPNLFTNDLEILNVFQWSNIKLISIQWQDSYDKEGRFKPEGSTAVTGTFAGVSTVRLAIDGFCFTKPLLAITSPVLDRPYEPSAMQLPDTRNSIQLQQIVDSQLEIESFQHKEFTITTTGKNDIAFGDTFFLNDSNIVNDSDTRTADSGGNPNTIRLVAKRIIYKITKPTAFGQAGQYLRTIIGIKRILT